MTRVVCLYRPGGDFKIAHVQRFAAQVRRYAPSGTKIVCFATRLYEPELYQAVDYVLGLTPEAKSWGWQGCWPKLDVFRLQGPALYLDLDVNIVGDLAPMLEAAAAHELVLCRDFWNARPPLINGSVIGWRGDMEWLRDRFACDPAAGKRCDGSVPDRHWSDQVYILRETEKAGIDFRLWQDVLPGAVLSYKNEVLTGKDRSRAKVIVSHGRPRPWETGGADMLTAKLFGEEHAVAAPPHQLGPAI